MAGKIELKAPLDGVVTIEPEDTASNFTVTIPAVTSTLLNTSSDIEAQVKTATNATGSAPIYACRAWVNVNASTLTINGSGNISSVTDEGTGRTKINFTDAMVDADYSAVGTVRRNDDLTTNPFLTGSRNHTTSSVEFIIIDFNGSETDLGNISVAIFR